jgi:hypothetical protein
MSYKEGIIKAIKELNDGDGSTVVRISKFMEENDLPNEQTAWNDKVFRLSLESLVLVGDLDQVVKTANYKLSDEYIQKCQAQSMFSNDLKNGAFHLMDAGCSGRSVNFASLKGDLDNADRFTTEYLDRRGLTPNVVAKLREVQGRSKEEKELEKAAFDLGLKALSKRTISIQAPDVPDSVWTVMCQPALEDEIYAPIHMDDARYEALIEHSDYDLNPEEMIMI